MPHSAPFCRRNPINVLFILSDDQQHDTIRALGNADIRTPNIDTVVQSGVAFTNAYIMGGSSPGVCSPSRACLLTGRTLWDIENQDIWGYKISEKFKTLPEVFRENSYITFATGKNHPGKNGQFHRSYTEGDRLLFSGTNNSKFRQFLHPFSPEGNYNNKSRVQFKGTHSTKIYGDACIDFIKRQASRSEPFYAYLAFQAPHDPRESPEEFRARYKDEEIKLPENFMPEHPFNSGADRDWDEKRVKWPRTEENIKKHIADYYALITIMDAQIGEVIEVLKQTKQFENGQVTLSAVSFKKHHHRSKNYSGNIAFFMQRMKVPPGAVTCSVCRYHLVVHAAFFGGDGCLPTYRGSRCDKAGSYASRHFIQIGAQACAQLPR